LLLENHHLQFAMQFIYEFYQMVEFYLLLDFNKIICLY